MLVTDSSIFKPGIMKLRISSMEGVDLLVEVAADSTVDSLKVLALSHLYSSEDSMKSSLYHTVLNVSSNKTLSDANTLQQEGVKEHDELILIHRRMPQPPSFASSEKKEEGRQAPTAEMIKEKTQGLPSVNTTPPPDPAGNVDFQTELRKILISLIDVSQKLLCLNPEAARIFKEAEDLLAEQASGEVQVDKAALKQLTDMGFPENRAIKALTLNKMSTMESMEWLLEHEGDADIDEPLSQMTSIPDHNDNEQAQGATGGVPSISKSSGSKPKVSNIVESFRAIRRREFKPNPRALKNLKDMGFKEKDIIDALRINRNREEQACEWLLSHSSDDGEVPQETDEDFDTGLDPNSVLYKAIMSNPVVQLGLNNPRSLLAFLNMLENPNNTQQWLSDADTGPMLIQISRIYHAERHGSSSTS